MSTENMTTNIYKNYMTIGNSALEYEDIDEVKNLSFANFAHKNISFKLTYQKLYRMLPIFQSGFCNSSYSKCELPESKRETFTEKIIEQIEKIKALESIFGMYYELTPEQQKIFDESIKG